MGGRIILSQEVGENREEAIGGFAREKTTKDKIPFLSKKLSQPFTKDDIRLNGKALTVFPVRRLYNICLLIILALRLL